jgi:hypothetical protein
MNTQKKHAGVPVLFLLLALAGCPNPSDSGGEAPELRGTVSLNGSPTVGGILTADTSLLEGTGTVSYQWILDESTVIEGAAGESYVPAAGDLDKTLKVRVSRAGYRGSVESNSVGPVAPVGKSFNYSLHDTIKYFSLSQGKELPASKSNTAEWDIAMEVRNNHGFCYIYTNSGDTAAELGNTGGQGGVWFTNKTDFDSVTLADRVTDFSGENADYEVYVTDVIRYQRGMYGSLRSRMNIMTYYGYESGDGSEADPFNWSNPGPPNHPFYEFNKKAFGYAGGGMPPPWSPTKQVYIIRHADGVSYSKFQVSTIKYIVGYTFNLFFKFENLDE